MSTILIKNGLVYYKNKLIHKNILIENEIIKKITKKNIHADNVIDATGLTIIPGLIDVHVHLREPGQSEKETIISGSMAGAAGGFSTICCMPNTNPIIDNVQNITNLLEKIKLEAKINVLPYSSITINQNGNELVEMNKLSKYCFAFSDDGNGIINKRIMQGALITARVLSKAIVSHSEDRNFEGNESEYKPIERDIEFLKKSKLSTHYHVCHISTKQSLDLIKKAKKEKLNVSCEVTPHHLLLNENDIKDDGCYKMNPPLRSKIDQQALIDGLINGSIDLIACDHAPHTIEEKNRGFKNSLNGIVGLETSFPLIYTHFVKTNKINFSRLIDLMSTNACKLFNIEGGIIKKNKIANVTIVDLNEKYKINANNFYSKGRSTPFNNTEVYGKVKYTIIDGKIVFPFLTIT